MSRLSLPARLPVVRLAAAVVAPAVLLVACSGDDTTLETLPPPQKVTMTYITADPQSELLMEMYAQQLESKDGADLRVARLSSVADTAALFDSVVDGRTQVAAMYTGDLLKLLKSRPKPVHASTTTIADTTPDTTPVTATPSASSAAGTTPSSAATADTIEPEATEAPTTTTTAVPVVDNPKTVEQELAAINSLLPDGVMLGAASTGENKPSIACSQDAITANKITNLSSLAKVANKLVLGAPADFETASPLGAKGLKDTYGITFKSVKTMADDAAIKKAIVTTTTSTSTSTTVAGATTTTSTSTSTTVATTTTSGATTTTSTTLWTSQTDVDCVVVSSGSVLPSELQLGLVKDNRFLVPGNAVVTVMVTTASPEITDAVATVTDKITMNNLSAILGILASGTKPHPAAATFLANAQPEEVATTTPLVGPVAPSSTATGGTSGTGATTAGTGAATAATSAATATPATPATSAATTPGT